MVRSVLCCVPLAGAALALTAPASAVAAAPSNDNLANAIDLTSAGRFLAGAQISAEATKESGEPNHAGNAGGHSVWFRFTPTASGRVIVSTCPSQFDSLIGVYTGANVASLTPVAASDDEPGCPFAPKSSSAAFTANAGTTYYFAVDGKDGATGAPTIEATTNDDFDRPFALMGSGLIRAQAINVLATTQPSEPDHTGAANGGHSVWYTATPATTRSIIVQTCTASTFTSALAAYSGTSVGSLTRLASTATSCPGRPDGKAIRFQAPGTQAVHIALDGVAGATGFANLGIQQNDDFAAPEDLSVQPGQDGDTTAATGETGEPNHAGSGAGNSLWYSWDAATDGPASFTTCADLPLNDPLDSVLAVYRGSSPGALTPVASNDNSARCGQGSTGSAVTFSATAGQRYVIAVDTRSGASTGGFQITRATNPADATAPSVSITSPADGATTTATPTFTGVAGTAVGDNGFVYLRVHRGSLVTDPVVRVLSGLTSGGTFSIPTGTLTPGTYTAQASQSDAGGNRGTSAPVTFTVPASGGGGSGGPAVTLTSPEDGSATSDPTPTFSGTAGNATGDGTSVGVLVYNGNSATGTPAQTLTATRSGTAYSVDATTLTDGTYTARASQSNSSGTGASSPVTFRVDTTAPAPTITAPANGTSSSNTTTTFSGAAGNGTGDSASVVVKVYNGTGTGGTVAQTITATRSGATYTINASPALNDGTYTARATQADDAGNTGTSPTTTFSIATAPGSAVTYCVHAPAGCSGITKATVTDALSAAATSATTDEIQVGTAGMPSGGFTETFSASQPVTVRGVGNPTFAPPSGFAISASGPGATVTGLTITSPGARGVLAVNGGAAASRMAITGYVDVRSGGSLTDSTIEQTGSGVSAPAAILGQGSVTLRDLEVHSTGEGIRIFSFGSAANVVTIDRVRSTARIGSLQIYASEGMTEATVTNSVLHAAGNTNFALQVGVANNLGSGGNAGQLRVYATGDTIVSDSGQAVDLGCTSSDPASTNAMTLKNVVLGAASRLARITPATGCASLTGGRPGTFDSVTYSAFNGSSSSGFPASATNRTANVDPMFTNATGDDYSLLPGSPLVDTGSPDAATSGETDVIGNARLVGTARDIGAYERAASSGGGSSGGGGGGGGTPTTPSTTTTGSNDTPPPPTVATAPSGAAANPPTDGAPPTLEQIAETKRVASQKLGTGSVFDRELTGLGPGLVFVPADNADHTVEVPLDRFKTPLFAIGCPTTACAVSVGEELSLGGAGARAAKATKIKLATRKLTIPKGAVRVITLKLTKAQRKALKTAKGAVLRVTVAVTGPDGKTAKDATTFRLKPTITKLRRR